LSPCYNSFGNKVVAGLCVQFKGQDRLDSRR
jgi:hypothetical protein